MNKIELSVCASSLALAVAAVGCLATAADRPSVPAQLQVGAEQTLALQAQASGFQIYTCVANGDASRFAWALQGPEAELFDSAGRKIGKHYAGPTWESVDGSKVGASVKTRAESPDGKAIPWLLLGATSNAGTGVLAHVASVQRLNTTGGATPPAQLCDEEHVGTENRVPYTATYYFYTASP
jgi:hypothetical protein